MSTPFVSINTQDLVDAVPFLSKEHLTVGDYFLIHTKIIMKDGLEFDSSGGYVRFNAVDFPLFPDQNLKMHPLLIRFLRDIFQLPVPLI